MRPLDDFAEWVIRYFLEHFAWRMGATEAAAFVVERGRFASGDIEAVVHLRPGDSDDETRANAVRAFREIALPYVRQGARAVVDVGDPDESGDPQFCLVLPFPPNREARLVFCLIVRARSEPRAREKVEELYGRA